MRSLIRRRATFANVTSLIALFVALGGTSYAALTITGKNVRNSSLTGADIKNSSLTTSDVKNRSLLAKDFKTGQLPQGPVGPQGAKGDKGATGSVGATTVVVKTIAASLGANSFTTGTVDCPAGTQAIGGGVDPDGVYFGKVAASAPLLGGTRTVLTADGNHPPATGWYGAVTTQGTTTGTSVIKVAVICAPVG